LNPRTKNSLKISGSNLKYSQIPENYCGDWFDVDCVAGLAVAIVDDPFGNPIDLIEPRPN
jgi:hypothetical protein